MKSQLSVLQRSEISNPPSYGARVVSICVLFMYTAILFSPQIALILNDEALFAEWKRNIATMAERIIGMRQELYRLLTEELHTPGTWEHIVNQIGMFRCVGAVCCFMCIGRRAWG